MSAELKGVFCNNSSKAKIILFNDTILEKCKILKIRVTYKLKYKELILPTTSDQTNGYHANCYSNFTAIKKKYIEMFSELVKSQQSENAVPESDRVNYESTAFSSDSQAATSCQPSTSAAGKNYILLCIKICVELYAERATK
ncbi:uncharacterized protein LOC107981714 [Nasonia vitripennis]|uniref:Uncharacterized protein n=1 Tax=Nasonia vitripennis TaxID=7425 RepID=A0A7M7T6D5_NASVI|nr:uncharacterized protein LOC107981714 [Nasonia vitripennis]